jgi:hypothetical protein
MMPICHVPATKCRETAEKCPNRGNVKTQFISTLFNSRDYTAECLNGNGDSDVHDDDQHTDLGGLATRPSDSDGYA